MSETTSALGKDLVGLEPLTKEQILTFLDTAELQDNAYRNQAEFAAEGWDYQKVLEDEDMYVDAETGELVHPFWIEQQQQEENSEEDSSSGLSS